MKKLVYKITVVLTLLVIAGCGAGKLCLVEEAQDSVICSISGKMNISPEALSQTLILANVANLEASTYTADRAYKFLETAKNGLIEKQASGITYGDVVNFLLKEYNLLPARIQAIFILIDPFKDIVSFDAYVNKLLTPYDIKMLIAHIEKQEAIVNLYM